MLSNTQKSSDTTAEYLLFPKGKDAAVYKDKELSEALGTTSNAVIATQQELESGVIETDFKRNNSCDEPVYVSSSSYTLVPPSDFEHYIQDMNNLYNECNFGTKILLRIIANDNSMQHLQLIDHQTLISYFGELEDISEYVVHDTSIIERSHLVSSRGLLSHLATAFFSVPLFLLTLFIGWLLRLLYRVKKKYL
jgi:hypothetical protein